MTYNLEQIMLEIIKNTSEFTFSYDRKGKEIKSLRFCAFIETYDMINPLLSMEFQYNAYDYKNDVTVPVQIRLYNSFAGEEGEAIYFDLDKIEESNTDARYQQFIEDCDCVLNNRISTDSFEDEYDVVGEIYNVFANFVGE